MIFGIIVSLTGKEWYSARSESFDCCMESIPLRLIRELPVWHSINRGLF